MAEKSCHDHSPVVSVIMPTYNQAAFIGKAIESVLLQSEDDLELIIIDNNSTDRTKEVILSHCDSRIQYLNFQNNGIIAASRNAGIVKSKGKYIAFLDSDDYWDPTKLKQQLIHFRDDHLVGVASRATLIGEKIYYREQSEYDVKLEFTDVDYQTLLNNNQVITSSMVVRATALSQSKFFNEDPDFICFEDWDLWLQLAKLGKIRILTNKLIHYFVARKRGEAYCLVAENMTKLIAKERNEKFLPDFYYREPLNQVFLTIARSYLQYDTKKSREYYWRTLTGTTRIRKWLKALLGLLICAIPSKLSQKLLFGLYQIEHALSWLKSGIQK